MWGRGVDYAAGVATKDKREDGLKKRITINQLTTREVNKPWGVSLFYDWKCIKAR